MTHVQADDPDDDIHEPGRPHGNANRMPRAPALGATANPDAAASGETAPGHAPPLVSIVLPVFNAEAHLGECLQGVALQTHRPLEVSICDNGSTDGTAALLAAWRPRLEARGVRWVCTTTGQDEGRGCGLARNVAIRAATGACRGTHVRALVPQP